MNSDIMPIEIGLILLAELLFGIAYNIAVAWSTKHRMMHVSVAVAIGVIGTLVVPTALWHDAELQFSQAVTLIVLCFAASGFPMIVGSQKRTVEAKDPKKRRPMPNWVRQTIDAAVMDLTMINSEIAEDVKVDKLTVKSLPSIVNRINAVIGLLSSWTRS